MTTNTTTNARDERQAAVLAWARAAFSEEQATGLPQRGIRMLEEAIELFQVCGTRTSPIAWSDSCSTARPERSERQPWAWRRRDRSAGRWRPGLAGRRGAARDLHPRYVRPLEEFARRNRQRTRPGSCWSADSSMSREATDEVRNDAGSCGSSTRPARCSAWRSSATRSSAPAGRREARQGYRRRRCGLGVATLRRRDVDRGAGCARELLR